MRAARLVQQVLDDAGLAGAAKTSGAKGLHVFVPLAEARMDDVAAATRAIAARAERLDPDLATTAFVREDRHGKVFLDSTRAGGATVVAPTARASGRAYPCPSRWPGTSLESRDAGRLHPAYRRRRCSADATLGRPDARAAGAAR